MFRCINSSQSTSEFTTFPISNVDNLLNYHELIEATKSFITTEESKRALSNDVFHFIDEAYDELGEFHSFKDMDRFINDSYFWYITYEGPEPQSESDIDINKVYVISVYRKRYGLKLVRLAGRSIKTSNSMRVENQEIRAKTRSAVKKHLEFMADRGWAEVSDKLETICHRVLGDRYIINPQYLRDNNIFKHIQLDPDPYDDHYTRPLRKGGPLIRKIAYGTLKI